MTTTDGQGVFPIEIDGTFDDCQNIVKDLFKDKNFNNEVKLGAINSINWGRIAAQIVYYFTSFKLLNNGPVSYSVPTGNFGDILAGWVAKKMGLPIKNLMIATNENDILSRALKTGTYSIDKLRLQFHLVWIFKFQVILKDYYLKLTTGMHLILKN
jgi:threonine synthase